MYKFLIIMLLLFSIVVCDSPAQLSPNKLLGINAAGTGREYKALVQGSNITITHGTETVTISASGGGGGGTFASAILTANRTTTSTSFSDVTNLSIPIGMGETWSFEAALTAGCSGTGGSQYTVTVPATYTRMRLMVQGNTSSATAWTGVSITTSGANTVTVCNAAAQGRLVFLRGTIVNAGSPGNIQVQFRSITSGQTTTCNQDSYITGRKH